MKGTVAIFHTFSVDIGALVLSFLPKPHSSTHCAAAYKYIFWNMKQQILFLHCTRENPLKPSVMALNKHLPRACLLSTPPPLLLQMYLYFFISPPSLYLVFGLIPGLRTTARFDRFYISFGCFAMQKQCWVQHSKLQGTSTQTRQFRWRKSLIFREIWRLLGSRQTFVKYASNKKQTNKNVVLTQ